MKAPTLWKISVTISPEAEDAVSYLLEDLVGQPASVYVDARRGTTVASVYALGARDWSAEKRATLRAGLRRIRACGVPVGSGRISAAKVRREDWAESWKRHFKPIEIGSALLLKPSWSKRQPKRHQAVMVLDPGLSFGTGQHPTTRFCLEQLVAVRKKGRAQSFLDIGTGSGILAIAAAKLGYRPVAGLDFDAEAIRIAKANAIQNAVARKLQLVCRNLIRLPLRSSLKYDLICANLIFDLLLAEKARILNRLKPGGVLVLAGILRSQFPLVRAAFEKSRLHLLRSKTEKEWTSGAFVREQIGSPWKVQAAAATFNSAKTMTPEPVCKRLVTWAWTCWPTRWCAWFTTTIVPSFR